MKTTFHIYGDLPSLLRGTLKGSSCVSMAVNRRASIKDVLESFGLPHTEVGCIRCKESQVDFKHIAEEGETYTVEPVPVPWNVTQPSLLRPEPLSTVSFIVDVNVGRLARYLRSAGLDTLYHHSWTDRQLADLVQREKRVLLTRDLRLLMRKQVVFGRYIRATSPVEQLHEVTLLFGLAGQLKPFSRCMECNSLLEQIAKKDILHRLEPLTIKYYNTFSRCPQCDKLYWPGSHVEKMQSLLGG